ncbi:hypothetical protein WB514_004612 [Vibrio parahaemolyticus]
MITFIFGAGASYGSGRCIPSNPPLGIHLYSELVKLGGAFSNLNGEAKKGFESEGFEAGMAAVPNNSTIINPLQKELACYLSSFNITQDNAYVRLFNRLRRHMDTINIVTLNYDLLIEQAICSAGLSVDYNGVNQGVNVLKPHGSSNFLPQIPQGINIGGLTAIDCGTFVEGFPTNAATSHAEIKAWCNDPKNQPISPALSLYSKDKRVVVNSELVKQIQKRYVELVSNSKLLVLVGIKYIPHDEHIWSSLEQSESPIIVVDPYPEDTIKWAASRDKKNISVIQRGFNEAVWDTTKAIRAYL